MKNKLITLFVLILILSCENKQTKDFKKIIITDFSEKRIDTLKPYESKSYYAYYIKVKGYSNDSIKIQRKGHYDIILSGNIDTIARGDYYGTENVIWIFEPFKATKGKLEIEYGL